MVNSKNAFWQAFVFTIIVFGIGMLLGFFLESSRADRVQFDLISSEINLLDDQLRNRIIGDFNIECDTAVESTFNFADKVYAEALRLEDYEAASKLSDESFFILHKRYDLLRTLLLVEAAELRERCNENFHTVVYFYNFTSEDIDINSKQLFYSRLLFDLKEEHPDNVLLIPIAADTGLESVNLLIKSYSLTEFPAIVIDEKEIIQEIISFEDLEDIILSSPVNIIN